MSFAVNEPGAPSICPDNDMFKFLAMTYARSHNSMGKTQGTECRGDFFPDGVTNGAEWYAVSGNTLILCLEWLWLLKVTDVSVRYLILADIH